MDSMDDDGGPESAEMPDVAEQPVEQPAVLNTDHAEPVEHVRAEQVDPPRADAASPVSVEPAPAAPEAPAPATPETTDHAGHDPQ
jgi:hypothetical protein